MESSRPRPSILLLFDPLSLTELDRATSSDSDKENNFIDTSDSKPSFGTLNHIHVPPCTSKRRLVDIGDITVEHPDMNALLSDELEQEISFIVDDDDNDTLTFRDMAKAATPKWTARHATVLETPNLPLLRTPLVEISLKHQLTSLARKKPYKHQPVSTAPKGSEPACLTFPLSIYSNDFSGCPTSSTEVPEVRVNDEPVAPNLSESSSSRNLNQAMPTETLVTETLPSSLVVPVPSQRRTRHLSPTSPADNANRHSVDLQTSFQIHFTSHDTTFDLLKDKISFFGSRNEVDEFDSFLNNLEGDSSLDDDILIPGPGSKLENDLGVSSTITLDQVVKSDKQLVDLPTLMPKDDGVTETSMTSHALIVQQPISNQVNTMPSLLNDTQANQTIFAQRRVFHAPCTSPPLTAGSRPMSIPRSFIDKPQHPPPQIAAHRIIERSKTITRQKPSMPTKDSPQDTLIAIGSCVPPVAEAPASSSFTVIKKGYPFETSKVRTDKSHLSSSLGSNGPRRVLISEGPKLNLAAVRTSEQGKHSSTRGPRRVPMTVPSTVMQKISSSARPPVQPSNGLQKPRTNVVKPVQRTAGSRLPTIARRIELSSGASGEILPN